MKFLVTISFVFLLLLFFEGNASATDTPAPASPADGISNENGTTSEIPSPAANNGTGNESTAETQTSTKAPTTGDGTLEQTTVGVNGTDNGNGTDGGNGTDSGSSTDGGYSTATTSSPTPDADNATTAPSEGQEGDAQVSCHQHFHAASFVGGIFLCGGIVGIIFFALIIYRKNAGNRYHQF